MSTHTAAILEAFGQELKLKSLPIPEPIHGSAVVKVLATQVSPVAKNVFAGHFPVPLRTPVTPSSSAIARIHTVGPDATSLKPGQLVFLDFWVQSRDDPDASILQGYMGGENTIEANWSNGTYAEYARVPLEKIWTLNEDLLTNKLGYSFADLAWLGSICIPLAGLMDIDTRPGDTVIVAPATGHFSGAAVQAAIALGARVVACSRNEKVLSKMADVFKSSRRFEFVKMVGEVEKDTAAIKAKCGSHKGADRFIDFSPPHTHIQACLGALRPHGSAVFMGAVFQPVGIPYWPFLRNNIRLQGRFMFDRHHGEQAVKMLEAGNLHLGSGDNSGIKSQSFKLQDVGQALETAANGSGWGSMVVLTP